MGEPSWEPCRILARGSWWGAVGGAVGGVLVIAVPALGSAEFSSLALCFYAAPIGAIVGSLFGLICSAVLLVPGRRWPRRHPGPARLLAGSVAAAPAVSLLIASMPIKAGSLWWALAFSALCFTIGAVVAHRVLWGVWRLRQPAPDDAGHRLAR